MFIAHFVIFEQHVSECRACAALLRRHQRSSALLFESYAEHRLSDSLASRVVENLPEVEGEHVDLERAQMIHLIRQAGYSLT